jgi:hypothetical protein
VRSIDRAVARHLHASVVDHEIAAAKHVTAARRIHATQHRSNARHQFPRTEWLGDVIVRSKLQAREAIRLVDPGGQHDDRNVTLAPKRPRNLEPVEARQARGRAR